MTEEKIAAIIFVISLVFTLTHWVAWLAGNERNEATSLTYGFILIMLAFVVSGLTSLVFLLLSAFN